MVLATQWKVSDFVYMPRLLRASTEGGSTLFENAVLYFSSEISHGNHHEVTNMPILVAGRAGGKLQTGWLLRFPGGTATVFSFHS